MKTKTMNLAVFDLDNCIFDDRHRQPLINTGLPLNQRYEAYHLAMHDDKPYAMGMAILKELINQKWMILFNTARPAKFLDMTACQLQAEGIDPRHYDIKMRRLEQEGKDTVQIKNENLKAYIESCKIRKVHFDKIIAFDDRPDIVENYGWLDGQKFANVQSFVITGSTLIYGGDKTSMVVAHNVFKGWHPRHGMTKNEGTASKRLVNISHIPGVKLDVFASAGAANWLRITFAERYVIASPDTYRWYPEDFPGAKAYNKKRSHHQLHPLTKEQKEFLEKMATLPGAHTQMPCKVVHTIGIDKGTGDTAAAVAMALQKVEAIKAVTAADILQRAADTFRDRNAVYKDNAGKVGQVMAVLFPEGVTLKTEADHKFYHLFELLIVKLTRFTNSGLHHEDSIHDLMVYAAMLEAIGVDSHNIKTE